MNAGADEGDALKRKVVTVGPDLLAVDIDMYLVLTQHGQYFISDDPQTVPALLLAIGPATLGVDGFDLPEDLAAALAQRVGIVLDQPDTWPRSADVAQLRTAYPALRVLP